ncbi:MAG: hypothetical protein QOG64_2103, partial [Acidimicrobiaceae bacterium]|nr:hypothetical protein [Acidimicrobiaceae bacterium]
MSLAPTLEDIPIIDVDTHVSEPGDLWTTRISSKYRDMAPHLVRDPDGRDIWTVSDKRLASPGVFATAGWPEYAPSHPKTLAEADPATWNPVDRLVRMDEYGLYAQVLYPNILAFYLPTFLSMGNPDFVADCIRAYNDFLVEFASADPERLLPMMLLPVWDMERCLAEFERCRDAGHRGVVLASTFAKIGLPPLWDRYWDRLFGASQEAGMSINFHVGFSELTE